MIYLVSNQLELDLGERIFTKCSMSAVEAYLESVNETSLDSETYGFDPHNDAMILLQIGDQHNQFLIDCATVDISVLKPHLERLLIIGQNLKFDLKFLYKQNIYPNRIYCTYVVEKVLTCGLLDKKADLGALALKYLNEIIDKTVRAFVGEGLSDRVIKYAAEDVRVLPLIKEKQLLLLDEQDLHGTANLENRFTPGLAYIEYCGFKLDVAKWTSKMENDQKRMVLALDSLNNWVLDGKHTKFHTVQLSLFEGIRCNINWGSSPQVIKFMEYLGVDVTVIDKGVKKKSVEAPVIQKHIPEFPVIALYLEYKKAVKVVGTYGETWINQINKSTGRLHTNFKQILNTGRISSGGKNKATKEEYPNFQNIPKDKETRACFVAEEGNTLLISDYSGQEQIVLANYSLDENILKFYDEGLADMHSFVASKMYTDLTALSVLEIKEHHADKRNKAKNAGFAINYGGVGKTIADNNNLTLAEGNEIYEAYFRAFPGLKAHFEKVKKQGLRDGYILISPVTRRKSYIMGFSRFKELEQEIDQEFWADYREAKTENNYLFPILKKKLSTYLQLKGGIERDSLNYPIQGSAAEITKLSAIYIYDYILKNNLFGIVLFVNTVHDEHVLECPIDMSEKIANMVRHYMKKAGEFYCKRVPLLAEPELSLVWKK